MREVDLFTSEDANYVYANVPIGSIPKTGTPMKDKNDADVYNVPDGIEVTTADTATSEIRYAKVSNFTVEKDVEIATVRTKSHVVKVSTNESMAVMGAESDTLVKVTPEDSLGEWVPVLKKSEQPFGDKHDFDLGWWIGSFVSDGWVSGERTIGYSKVEDAKRGMFERIARSIHPNFTSNEYTGEKGSNKLGNSKKIHLNGVDLYKRVAAMDMTSVGKDGVRQSIFKRLPMQMIMEGSQEFLVGVFCGLIDGDGSVVITDKGKRTQYSFRFSTSSPALRDSIKFLCYKLGVAMSVTTTPPRNKSREAYSLIFVTTDVLALSGLMFVGEREITLLDRMINEYNPDPLKAQDFVVVLKDEALAIKDLSYEYSKSVYNAIYDKRRRTELGVFVVEREALRLLFDKIDSAGIDYEDNSLMVRLQDRMLNTNLLWQKVKSVELSKKEDVFDIAVEGTKVFEVDSGLIVYDTMSTSIPISPKAVKEAWGLLPSMNGMSTLRKNSVVYMPSQEYLHGSIIASRKPKGQSKFHFKTKAEAMQALKQGKIKADTPIMIG